MKEKEMMPSSVFWSALTASYGLGCIFGVCIADFELSKIPTKPIVTNIDSDWITVNGCYHIPYAKGIEIGDTMCIYKKAKN